MTYRDWLEQQEEKICLNYRSSTRLKHLALLATISYADTRYLPTVRIKKERLFKDLSAHVYGSSAALEDHYVLLKLLKYCYILASILLQAYIKLKEKEIKVGKGKKGRSWQIRQYYGV